MAHLHMFFGNTAADANSTYSSLRTTGGSTCEGGPINRTAYWVPAMFDGNGRVVAAEIIVVYYKGGASGGSLARQQEAIRQVQPLPPGLRMVAGAPGGHIELAVRGRLGHWHHDPQRLSGGPGPHRND